MSSPHTQSAALLRGGRLRKTSRGVFTFAPFLATASAVALGALLSLTPTNSAHAGSCSDSNSDGTYECTGAVDMSMDSTESISASSGATLTVTDEGNTFGIHVTSGNAFTISATGTETAIVVDLDGNITSTAGIGVDVNSRVSTAMGDITITTAGTIMASGDGIEADVLFGDMTINASGAITSSASDGIDANHQGDGPVTITAAAVTGDEDGIDVSTLGNASTVTVNANGVITAGTEAADDGIYINHNGNMDAVVNVASGANISGGGGIEIRSSNTSSSNIVLSIAAMIDGNDAAAATDTAINLRNGAGQRLRFNPGAAIATGDLVIATRTDAVLELNADAGDTGASSFDLGRLSDFHNGAGTPAKAFTNFDKVGAGTWTLTGTQTANRSFASADVMAGTLQLSGATLQLENDANLVVASGATLEAAGAGNSITGGLDGSAGAISLAMSGDATATDDRLSVTDFVTGGTLTLNVALDAATDTADVLTISGTISGDSPTRINLVVTGEIANLDSSVVLVMNSGSDAGDDDDFDPGTVMVGDVAHTATLARDSTSGTWSLTALALPSTGGGGDNGGGGVTPPPVTVMPECEEQSTMGSFTCRGAFTEGQTLAAESGESLNVMTDPGFSITTDTGNALTLTGAADSTGMVVSLGGATISSTADDGIGIDADHAGSGDVTITASGAVSGGDTGIDVTHSGSGGNVSVTADDVSGSTGISAAITGTDNTAGTVSITVGGRVSGTGMDESDAAISMSGGSSQTLTLNTGARISGDIVANAVAADAEATTIPATLTLAGGSGSSSLNLSTLSGFSALEKTGNGTWELTGVQGTMDGFTNANVRGGTLRLNDATLRPGDSTLTIASGAILEVIGESTVAGALSSTGAISLAVGDDGTDDQLTVSGTFSGTVTMNANLSNPESPTADQLVLDGSGSNSVTLNLRVAANEDLELTPAQLTALQNALIGGSASNVSITAGDCVTTRTGSCTLTATGGNLTALTITLAAADAAVYESYASTLTELARLQSRQQRLSGRTYSPGQPVWGQIQAGNTTLEPATSSEGSVEYDLQDIRARFGFDVPLHHLQDAEIFPITLGMNAWIAEGDSDITASNGTGTLESDAFGFAATATLEQAKNSGIYADAQLQYAAFSSDMASGGSELAKNQGADSFSASAEVGMRLPPLHGFTLTPQVQLLWSDVEFDDFTDSKEVLISLADGETLTARLGLAAEHALQLGGLGELGGDGILRAAADLHLPLDGKTGIRIAEESFTSDLQEVAFSLSAGAVFSLTEAATLSADLATTHGSETETYRASLTTRLAF